MSDETQTGQSGEENGEESDDVQPGDDGRFDGDYVRELRSEAAERRRKLREAEERLAAEQEAHRSAQGRLVELEVHAAAAGILADPSDLLAHVDPADILDDGRPDPEKIQAAARALVERKPHLAPRRPAPAGDVDQGARPPTPPPFGDTFAGMLRKAAG